MSTFTKYKKIEKPISIERYSVDIVNKNSDIIDSELHKLELKNEIQDNSLETKASREALDAEASRAAAKENTIENNLSSEISRAQSAEYQISRDLGSEVIRASEAEAGLDAKLSVHDTSDSSHNDLRLLISGLTARLNALADSDDTTLDQLSEIVAYIKNNKSLIDGVTTNKVNVSDIIDNLTSSKADKPLSAKQGKVLKDLIDALVTVAGNKVDKISGKGLSTNDYTTDEKNKLNGIAAGAEVNVQADWVMADSSSGAYIKNKPDIDAIIGNAINSITPSTIGLGNVDNTSDNGKPVSVAQQAALDALYQQLAGYTDQEIADLIGGAPSTLDTLGKLAQAMQSNGNVVTALDEAIGKKASAAEFDSHVKDKANPHAVTKAQVGLGNVDNTADANKYVKFSEGAGNANTANYASSAGNADRVDDYHAYQLQNCTTAGVPEATYIKSTYNYGTFLLKAYNSSGNAVCGVEVEKASKAGSADSVAYSNVTGRPNMYWEGDVFHIDF